MADECTRGSCLAPFLSGWQTLREAGVIRQEYERTKTVNNLRKDDLSARFPGLIGAVFALARPSLRQDNAHITAGRLDRRGGAQLLTGCPSCRALARPRARSTNPMIPAKTMTSAMNPKPATMAAP